MKNKKILIIIAIVAIVAIVAIIMMSSGTVPGVPGISSASRDIKYINKEGGKDNKLAYLLETTTSDIREHSIIAVTIDDKFTFNEKKGYFDDEEREDDEIEVVIDYDGSLRAGTYGSYENDIVEISDIKAIQTYSNWGEIVKHDENWLLTKGDMGYYVWYSIDNDWIIENSNEYSCKNGAIKILDEDYGSYKLDDEQEAISMYEHLRNIVKVYKVKNTDTSIQYPRIYNIDFSKAEFIDAKGNKTDLSDYQFVRDMVAKSLEPYDIYLRNSQWIENTSGGMALKITYNIYEGESRKDYYEITVGTFSEDVLEENDWRKIVEKFNKNGREYVVMKTTADYLYVYSHIKDNVYINICNYMPDGADPAPYIQEIKDNIL